jgi:hypothetical protein
VSINLGVRTRGRFVDMPGGTRAYLIACGNTVCSASRFEARLVDYKNGEPVYAFLTECFEQPLNIPGHSDTVTFVDQGGWPPIGITDVVVLKFLTGLPSTCWDQPDTTCPQVFLFWDGSKFVGDLAGTPGTIHIELKPDGGPDPDHPGYPLWNVYFSNCISPTHVQAMHTLCIFPFQLNSESDGFLIPTSCCSVSFLSGPISVNGFTQRRYMARKVGVKADGTPVYMLGNCCPPANCGLACCECAASPVEWQFTVAGVLPTPPSPPLNCPCANATYTLVFTGVVGGVCTWTSTGGTGCGQWVLRCFNDTRKWQLEFSGGESAGGATYELGFDSWNCMGTNVMNFVSASPCTGWPATLTIVPV